MLQQIKYREGIPLLDFIIEVKLVNSKNEAKKMFKQKAIYVNNKQVNEDYWLTERDILPLSHCIILRKGKKQYLILRLR